MAVEREACLGTDTLVEILEGRASEGTRARVDAHASTCTSCREALSSLARGTDRAPGEATTLAAPPLDGPTAAAPGPAIGAAIDRYVITRLLGAGGMGVVFAAHDPALDRPVAIKLLRGRAGDPDTRGPLQARLQREAQALAQLAHPNVVAVHDVGTFDGQIFVAMELVDGDTLARWLAAAPRTPREVLDVFVAAGRGLAAAHAAGLVHRDFKPENVLVGRDGRVRVADFGLARTSGGDATAAAGADRPVLGALTATGGVLGTPVYMAPEQHRGEPVDARSDQFSYCVALHLALHGTRPFAGETYDELARAVLAGDRVKPPARPRVPRRIAAAIARGLARRPEDRFPSMAALLAALAPRPRYALWAIPTVASLAVAAVALARGGSAAPPCEADPDALRGTWDRARIAQVTTALRATGSPFADATVASVVELGERYAGAIVTMRGAACRAARVRREQTVAVMQLRMTCLDERTQALRATVEQLAAADRAIAERAVAAMTALPAVDACADVPRLTSAVPLPDDPAARAAVEALRAQLVTIRAMREAGRYADAQARLAPLLADATATAFAPLLAEVHQLRGELEADRGDFAAASGSLQAAAGHADAARRDPLRARALIDRAEVVGQELRDLDRAGELLGDAHAVIERLGRPGELQAAYLDARGAVAFARGDLATAERELVAALAMRTALHGERDLRRAETLRALGNVLLSGDDRAADARRYYADALAIQEAVLGAEHPDVALALAASAGVDYMQSRYAEAIATYQRAQALLARTVGADDHRYALVLDLEASAWEWNDGAPKAIELHRRAYEIAKTRLGPDHRQTMRALGGLAQALDLEGRSAEALAALETLLASQRRILPPTHRDLGATLHTMAVIEVGRGRAARALELGRAAHAILAQHPGYRPYAELATIGQALMALRRYGEAVDVLEPAVAALVPDDDPRQAAWIRSWLGRALVDAGRDRARGLQLVRAAWPVLARDPQTEAERASLAPWMRAHGLATAIRQ